MPSKIVSAAELRRDDLVLDVEVAAGVVVLDLSFEQRLTLKRRSFCTSRTQTKSSGSRMDSSSHNSPKKCDLPEPRPPFAPL
jgi:hypothetical protein